MPFKSIKIGGFEFDKEFILKFLRFCVAGAISFGLQVILTYLFSFVIQEFIIATTVAILVTQVFHFWLSKDFAFRYKEKSRITQFVYFLGTRSVSILMQIVVTNLGTNLFQINWVMAQLIGILVAMLFSFATSNWLIFKKPTTLKETELKQKQITLMIYLILFLSALFVGLLIVTDTPPILNSDNLYLYLDGKVTIAYGGFPYYHWHHTPLYKYLISFVLVIFGSVDFYLRLTQVVIFCVAVCFVYATVVLKKSQRVAIIAAILYMLSYFTLYAATDVHEEGLVTLFIILSFYFAFRYEKERKGLWFWAYMLCLGLAFFTKETVMVVLAIYAVYMIFWIKPPKKDLFVGAAIFGSFLLALLYVEYIQDWWIIKTYLGVGDPSADAFLSKSGIDFSNLVVALAVEPIAFTLALLNGVALLTKLIRKKHKIGSDDVLAISLLIYLVIYVSSRAMLWHIIYITFISVYLASDELILLIQYIQRKSPKFATLIDRNPRKAFALVFIPLLTIQMVIFAPNLVTLRNRRGDDFVAMYCDIASIVQDNKTYCETHNGINYYIKNLYSFNGYYNSRQRHEWLSWNESDIITITAMNNITDLGLKYFIYEDFWVEKGSFFYEIVHNGTLKLVKSYTYDRRSQYDAIWWSSVLNSTVELYEYSGEE